MKNFILSLGVAALLIGCGGGGGGSDTPSIAEATTRNAFAAYDALGVSTYLPSLMMHLIPYVDNDGVDATSNCNGGGSIDVAFNYPSGTTSDEYGTTNTIEATYTFHGCTLLLNANKIYLNGKLLYLTYAHNMISAGIEKGFVYKVDGAETKADISYKSGVITTYCPNKGCTAAFYMIDSVFHERSAGDVVIEETTIIDNSDRFFKALPKGIVFDTAESERIAISVNGKMLFGNAQPSSKLELIGKEGKRVDVWQDTSGTVFAQSEDAYETSFTTRTPLF